MFGKRFWAVSRRAWRVGACGLWLASGILPGAGAGAATPAPGTIVTTAVTASYGLPDGSDETSQSNMASFVVGRAGGVAVQPAEARLSAVPGQTMCAFPLLIQNTGFASDRFAVTIAVPDGWSAVLVPDDTGSGGFQASKAAGLTLPLALDKGQSLRCCLQVTCPANLAGDDTVGVRLTSQADPSQSALFSGIVAASPARPGALPLGWRVQTGGPVLGEAALWHGIAYVGSDDGCLYAIAATPDSGIAPGTVLWRGQTRGRVRGTPAVYAAPNGREQVSAGNDAGCLTTWDAQTGQPLWSAFVGLGNGGSWRARPLVSPDGSLVCVAGSRACLWSLETAHGLPRRRAPWQGMALAGNPTLAEADNGAWLVSTSGWGTLVRGGFSGRRVWLGGPAAGSLALDTVQNCLLGVTASGHVMAFDPASLTPDPRWPAGGALDLNVSVAASPALDAARGVLYVVGGDHAVHAVRTADGTMGLPGWPFAPGGIAGSAFRAAPLLWPSQDGAAPTLYVGDTGGEFYAVPTDRPGLASVFTPDTDAAALGEWDAAGAASGVGPQDVVVAGNSNGGVYGFRLR